MTNRVFGKKLGRNHNERQALFKSLAKSMFIHGQIETTEAKAKAVTPLIEKLCSVALKKDLSAYRYFHAAFQNKKLATQSVLAVNQSFASKSSNFTKLTRVKRRQGDDALIVKMSFTSPYSIEKKQEKVTKETPAKPKKVRVKKDQK